MIYIVMLAIGVVLSILLSSLRHSKLEKEFKQNDQALDEKVQGDKDAVAGAQQTADEEVKKYEEETRDYSSSINDPNAKNPRSS